MRLGPTAVLAQVDVNETVTCKCGHDGIMWVLPCGARAPTREPGRADQGPSDKTDGDAVGLITAPPSNPTYRPYAYFELPLFPAHIFVHG